MTDIAIRQECATSPRNGPQIRDKQNDEFGKETLSCSKEHVHSSLPFPDYWLEEGGDLIALRKNCNTRLDSSGGRLS